MILRRVLPYFKNAYKEIYVDRGMLLTDFCLATITPYTIQILLWGWFFENANLLEFNGYSYNTLMIYYIFVIAFNRMNNGYDVVKYYSTIVHSGSLSAFICKPLSLMCQRLLTFLGSSVLYFIPVFCAYGYYIFSEEIFNHQAILIFLKLVLVICISLLLSFSISYFFAIITLLIYRPNFLLYLLAVLQVIFGGVLIPSNFWPKSMHFMMEYNPFYFTIAAPVEVIMEQYSPGLFYYILISTIYILLIGSSASFLEKKIFKISAMHGG